MKVTWTNFALESLHEIYDYYKHNANIIVANKIRTSIFNAVKQLKSHPNSGTKELLLESINEGHRYSITANYKILYKIIETNIYILQMFLIRGKILKR
jgi:plasmid stabilization system protein ParE